MPEEPTPRNEEDAALPQTEDEDQDDAPMPCIDPDDPANS